MLRAAVLAVTVALGACSTSPDPPPEPAPGERLVVPVLRVVDGDTIHVELSSEDVTIRLIGIVTPEVDGPFTDRECFGALASGHAHELFDGTIVELEFDIERLDRFGRTLAYVWLDDVLTNELLVRDGYEVVTTFPPNVRYVDRFLEAERAARDEGAGLWSACR
jgi:micrococcal nuclease